MVRVRLAASLAALCGVISIAAVETAAAKPCPKFGRDCTTITVPLDRSGEVPGTVRLHVETDLARDGTRPPLFLIAGGPGQSATAAYAGTESLSETIGTEVRARDVVVMDLRGTGKSGALRCPSLEQVSALDAAGAAATCAAALGPRRAFYSSVDQADDIEAVRQALGAERIALHGVSYGTHVAQVYARRYPNRVERLVLDSVVGPSGVDAFERSSMRAVPRILGTFCGNRCRGFTRSAAGDVSRLAKKLEQSPIAGPVVGPGGKPRRARISAQGLLALVTAADQNPFLRAFLPAAVRAALEGDETPLLRAKRWGEVAEVPLSQPRIFSAGAYAATLCEDTVLPWAQGTSAAARRPATAAFVAAQPAGAFDPFGPRTALDSDIVSLCEGWPESGRPNMPQAALPDVPALLLAGDLDVRTPIEDARAVAAELPHAELLLLGNAGHGVTQWDLAGCVATALRRFLAGGSAGGCPAVTRFMSPLPKPPQELAELRPAGNARGRAGRTLRAVQLTFLDGVLSSFSELYRIVLSEGFSDDPFERGIKAGALRRGSYVFGDAGFRFRRASVVPGVRVSGRVALVRGRNVTLLRISGPAAARGRLTIRRGNLTGRLGGHKVRARLGDGAFLFALGPATGRSSQHEDLARRLPGLPHLPR